MSGVRSLVSRWRLGESVAGGCYLGAMPIKSGRVVDGQVVLDDGEALSEGAQVRVWVEGPGQPAEASEEELALIDQGRRDAREGKLLDARSFLRELRRVS